MTLSEPKRTLDALLEHRDFVTSLTRHCSHSLSAADDLEQETWLAALRNPPRDTKSPRGWLSMVVRNLATQQARKNRRHQDLRRQAPEREDAPAAEVEFGRESLREQLADAMEQLPGEQREVLGLQFGEGLSLAEISRRTGIHAKRVSKLSAQALESLRRKLSGEGRDRWQLALVPWLRWPRPERPVLLAVRCALLLAVIPAGAFVWSTLSSEVVATRDSTVDAELAGGASRLAAEQSRAGLASRDLPLSLRASEPPSVREAASQAELVGPESLTIQVNSPFGDLMARAEVFSTNLGEPELWTSLGLTNEDGQLEIAQSFMTGWRSGDLWIGATHPTFGPSMLAARLPLGGADSELDLVQLQLGGAPKRLHGQVVNQSGDPVPGARVWLEYREMLDTRLPDPSILRVRPTSGSTIADEEGRFELQAWRKFSQRIHAAHPDYCSIVFPVRRKGMSQELTLSLPQATVVSGVVTTPRGDPAVGVKVRVLLSWGSVLSTETDAAGRYELGGVPPDACTLIASGNSTAALGTARTFVEPEPGSQIAWSPQLEDRDCISGKVRGWKELATRGRWRVMLEPREAFRLPSASNLLGPRASARFSTPDSDGAFAFSGCDAGPYRVTLQRLQHDELPYPVSSLEDIASGSRDLYLSAVEAGDLASTASLSGSLGPSDLMAPTVLLATTGRASVRHVAVDPLTNTFSATNLPAGEYTLWACSKRRRFIALAHGRRVVIGAGQELDLGVLPISAACSLAIDMKWPGDRRAGVLTLDSLMTGVSTRVTLEPSSRRAYLNAQGIFEVQNLEPGAYTLTISYERHMRFGQVLHLESGEQRAVQVDMNAGHPVLFEVDPALASGDPGLLHIDISSPSGDRLRRITLGAERDEPKSWFKLTKLPLAEFRIDAHDESGRSVHTTIDVKAGEQPLRVPLELR